jgi:hypothetical protein
MTLDDQAQTIAARLDANPSNPEGRELDSPIGQTARDRNDSTAVARKERGRHEMSDEYRIHLDGPVSLDSVVKNLGAFGLRVADSNGDSLSMIYEQHDAEQMKRWGRNVRLEREGDDLFVTLNATRDRKSLMCAIHDAIASQGINATIEEL